MKLSGFLTTILIVLITAPGFGTAKLFGKNCDNGLSSTLLIVGKNKGCYSYQMTVLYDGLGSQELANMTVQVPCGTIASASTSRGWPIQQQIDPNTGLLTLKVDSITGFGSDVLLDSFTIDFSLCTNEIVCACDLATLSTTVGYATRLGNSKDIIKKGKNPVKGNGANGPNENNLCLDYETVTVLDSLVCKAAPVAELTTVNSAAILKSCPESSDTLNILITGNEDKPWSVVYTNGTENFQLAVDTAVYALVVSEPGQYSLVSVTDADGFTGTVSGSVALEHFVSPTANLTGDFTVCTDELASLSVQLTGTAPWIISYTDGINNFEATSLDSVYTFNATSGTYTLLGVSDSTCSGTVTGSATVTTAEVATATLSGGGLICDGESATLTVELTGSSPWTFSYTNGVETFVEEATTATHNFQVSQIGTYSLLDVQDAKCTGTVSGSAVVSVKEPVTGSLYIDPEYCMGSLIALKSSVTESSYTYLWTTTGNGEIVNPTSTKASYQTVEGDAVISFTLHVNNGCATSEITTATTVIYINADFTELPLAVDGQLTVNTNYTFSANFLDAEVYKWNVSDGTTGSNMTLDHTFTAEGPQSVSLTVSTSKCVKKIVKAYDVIASSTVYVTNSISTLSTEEETQVTVSGENIDEESFSFEIYDQWGAKVYETTSLNEAQVTGWIAKEAGQQNSVYAYVLQGRFTGGKSFVKRGRIMVK